MLKAYILIVKASETESKTSKSKSENEGEEEGMEQYEEYEIVFAQPYGLKFIKGRDDNTYIDSIDPLLHL